MKIPLGFPKGFKKADDDEIFFIISPCSWHWASCVRSLVSLYLESNPLEKYDWAEEKKSPSKFYFRRSNVVDEIDEIDYEGIENIILDNLNQVLNNCTMLNKYTRSMMITLKLVLQSGYGTETSDSIYNMMMTIVVMFVGWIYATYVLIVVSNVMMASANSENKFEEMSMELDAFCAAKRLSQTLTTKIKTFFKYKFQTAYFNENAIKQSTPANLSKEIMMHTCSNLVAKVQLFKEIPQLLLENIISCLKIEIYFPGDVIIKAGATGDAMFFIAFGTARIYSTSGEHFTFHIIPYVRVFVFTFLNIFNRKSFRNNHRRISFW